MNDPCSLRAGKVRVAVVQSAPVTFDTPRTLNKLAELTAEAAKRQAELVVFPEAFVGGYPKGYDFGVRLGVRTPEGRDEFRRLFESAITIPGPETERIGKVARDHAVHLVVGVIERVGGTLYCAALMVGPNGSTLGIHRKILPTALERVIWGSGDGSSLSVVSTPLGKLGAVICWENYVPALRMATYARGIELYCALTVDDRETWIPTMRHVALEGRCFVMSACQFLRSSELPRGISTAHVSPSDESLIRGGSCIVGPLGELLAGPVYGEECILTADLDRADLIRAKLDFDVVGHYSRPDVFRLHVNEQKLTSVVFEHGNVPRESTVATPNEDRWTLRHVRGAFAVCKLSPDSSIPAWATSGELFSVTRTSDELSIICSESVVPDSVVREQGWRCLRVAGAMPFSVVGVLASLTTAIARAGVSVFAFSTFDTDYLLIKDVDWSKAIAALHGAGHRIDLNEFDNVS